MHAEDSCRDRHSFVKNDEQDWRFEWATDTAQGVTPLFAA